MNLHQLRERVREAGVWCVRHRDGWCASKGRRKPADDAINVPTRCNHFVILPGGIEKREPDCPDCLSALITQENEDG